MLKTILTGAAFLFTASFFSQNHNHNHFDASNARDGENVEYCATHKKLEKLMEDPAFVQQRIASQNQLAAEELALQAQELNKAATVYKVPIVFHVLHNGGNEKISRAQILDGLRILNRDFRKQNLDANNVVSAFQGMPSDIEIEFVLASVAPNGHCFSGITYTKSSLTVAPAGNFGGQNQVDAIIAGNDVYQGEWQPSKYLNIYICKEIGGAAGYTFNPSFSGGSMFFNGIFVLSTYVGSVGTSSTYTSRTLTHEVGHWLNLSHVWGPNNNPGNQSSCNDDDGVSDTPNTKGVTSCNLAESSCGVLANVENYMDYSYCSKMFTSGQRSRMRAALQSSVAGRNNLWKNANLTATGTNGNAPLCKAGFSVEERVVCAGTQVSFSDDSYHSPTSWNWSFPGGTPSSSSVQNPVVTYSTPGFYSVSLTVSNNGGSLSETLGQFIKVLPGTGIAPIQEGFEYTASLPSNKWFTEDAEAGFLWQPTTSAAASGSQSVMVVNSANNAGTKVTLESTTITLDLNISASISFKYAFAKRNGGNNDKLKVKVSKNCGQTWATKKQLSGSTFTTAPSTSGNFIPTSSQWKTATISSNSLGSYLESDFRIKFIFESDGGNNLYIDDVNINGPVTIKENKFLDNLVVYPNPTEGIATLSFYTNKELENVSIDLYDIIGKKIKEIHNGELLTGDNKFLINTLAYEKGVYFIKINNNGNSVLKKLIVK